MINLNSLLEELKTADEATRLRAMYQIGILGDPTAIQALQNIYKNDAVPELRQVARAAAQHIQQTRSLSETEDAELDVKWTQHFVEYLENSPNLSAFDISDLTAEVSAQAAAILETAGATRTATFIRESDGSAQQEKKITPLKPRTQSTSGTRSETTGVYEMNWDCQFCGTQKLLGVTHRFCPNCGAPQDANNRYFPKEGEEVAVENHVYHGVDRICPSCEQPNSAAAKFCITCGTDLSGAGQAAIRVDDANATEARDTVKEQFQADLAPAAEASASRGFLGLRRLEWSIVGVVTTIVACVVGGIFAATFQSNEDLVVEAHSWERIVHLEEYTQVRESKDCVHRPSDAYNISSQTVSRTRKVPDGQTCRQECTTRRVDRGDGSFSNEQTCRDVCTTNYRNETYYVDVCTYNIDRWRDGREVKASGRGISPAPYWPEYMLASGSGSRNLGRERLDEREENYVVHMEREDGSNTECEFDSESKWRSFADGDAVNMNFNIMGNPLCDSLKTIN